MSPMPEHSKTNMIHIIVDSLEYAGTGSNKDPSEHTFPGEELLVPGTFYLASVYIWAKNLFSPPI